MPKHNQEGRTARFIQDGNRGGFNRGQFGGGSGGRSRNDHDDRLFKFTSHKSRAIQRKNFNNRVDESGDTIMDGGPSRSGYQGSGGSGKGRGNRARGNNREWNSRNSSDSPRHSFGPNWHKITVVNGNSYSADFILTSLTKESRATFIPIAYTVMPGVAVFFVESRLEAEGIAEVSGRIVAADSQKITFKVKATGPPPSPNFDENVEQKLKLALEKRYNAITLSLNLENFHASPDLITSYYLPIVRGSVIAKIFSMLEPIAETLLALDLSNNKLMALDSLRILKDKTPVLKILNIGKNKIRDPSQLEKLSGLQIQELIFADNPIRDIYKDRTRYISEIRKRFPKLLKLDGIDIPPQITFDLEAPTKAPESKGSFFCNEKAQQIILTFVEQYFCIYDAESRKDLLNAYHDKASLSLCSSYPSAGHIQNTEQSKRLNSYLGVSRNLLRNSGNDKARRIKLLRQGKQEVVDFIEKLPRTMHDTNGFTIDMPLATERFIQFTVVGVFKEREERQQPLRSFSRTFFIVPQNGGYVIINELIFVSLPSQQQSKVAFKLPAPTPSPSPIPYVQQPQGVPAMPSIAVAPTAAVSSLSQEEERNQMIMQFSQQSGLKVEWSKQCLEDNGWDFQKSAIVFTELKNKGQLPENFFQVK